MARPVLTPRPDHRPRVVGAVVLGLTLAAACGGTQDAAADQRARDAQDVERLADEAARAAAGDPRAARDTGLRVQIGDGGGARVARGDDPPLGPGDVRVTSTGGELVLAVVGDTVRARLGDSVMHKVQREMAADTRDTSGFGGFVARTVQGAVTGAVGAVSRFALRVPVREVRDLEYRNGELRFRTGAKGTTNAPMAQADAERFMAAVRERQQRPVGR